MEPLDNDAVDKMFQRLTRESKWLKEAYAQADVRDETLALLSNHFAAIAVLHQLVLNMVKDMTEDEYKKFEPHIKGIDITLNELQPHAEDFKKIYDRLPNKYTMYLATVDAPPHKM